MKSITLISVLLVTGSYGLGFNKLKRTGLRFIQGEELDFNIMGDFNVNAMPQLFNFGKKNSNKDTTPVEVPATVQLKADALNAADSYVKKTDRGKLARQVTKFVMKPTMKVFVSIAGVGAGFADRPNLTPKVVETVADILENDSEVVTNLFSSLDKIASQDSHTGELIRDIVIKPYANNKKISKYVTKISSETYKQNPKAAKVAIDKLLVVHSKHDLISDKLAVNLKGISDKIE
ncbi:hypothetical protein K502DRAFT_355862 [Neoconidiobolus thromboides FSU 785]|nr:hypothetical protein K502DRAFT_355862 [Neoconidiobolus thromboides FSU 785]